MYLYAAAILFVLLLLYFNKINRENFSIIRETFDLVKNPRANVNKLRRKLRVTRDKVHKEQIRPLHNNLKKIFI